MSDRGRTTAATGGPVSTLDGHSERAVHFGPAGSLFGVITEPAKVRPNAPTVLLINAGLIHRVGPNRLYVQLARRLAKLGFPCMRFDLSGVGDSSIVGGDRSVWGQAQSDIDSAMDVLARTVGGDRYVAMGLCSGAFLAHAAAVADERVVGCVQLDGYIYPTRRYYMRKYGPRVLRAGPWIRLLKRALRRASKRTPASTTGAGPTGPENETPFAAVIPPRDVFARELAGLVGRRTRLLFVLTGGGPQPVNYARQLHDCVPEVDLDRNATVLTFPDAGHTFTLAAHRRALLDAIAEWMVASF